MAGISELELKVFGIKIIREYKKVEMNITGKHISILGAVRSGIGAAKLAKKLGAIPFVSDLCVADKIDILDNEKIEYETGKHSDRVFECDFILTSPGVPST